MENKKPIILITGYLGAGKTTLMQKLLEQEKRRIALIVNDMGSINIDASLLGRKVDNVAQVEMVEMQNGCICCTLRDEFIQEIERLSNVPDIEAVFVEASGISEPSAIANAFLSYAEDNPDTNVYLSSIVSVADADRIYREFLGGLESADDAEDGDIINLVIDQIEFCNVIVLNKTDLLTEAQIEAVKAALRNIQRKAEIIPSVQGAIDPSLVMHGEAFDYDEVLDSAVLQRTLNEGDPAAREACVDEYGISSFIYEDRKPLNRERFMALVEDWPEALIRSKGYLWFSDDPTRIQLFEQAGRNASVTELTEWMCAIPKDELDALVKEYPDITEDWDETYGDRVVQLVFIGKDYRKADILERFTACLDA